MFHVGSPRLHAIRADPLSGADEASLSFLYSVLSSCRQAGAWRGRGVGRPIGGANLGIAGSLMTRPRRGPGPLMARQPPSRPLIR